MVLFLVKWHWNVTSIQSLTYGRPPSFANVHVDAKFPQDAPGTNVHGEMSCKSGSVFGHLVF